MKVKDLIETLKNLNPESMVVVRGYEGGVNEVNYATPCEIYLNVNTEYYYGKHEVVDKDYYDDIPAGTSKTNAVRLHV